MKGKAQRNPIIFVGTNGKVYKNGSMPKIAKVTKVEPKAVSVIDVIEPTPTERQTTTEDILFECMSFRFPDLGSSTIKAILEIYPKTLPAEIKDEIISQGYSVEEIINVLDAYRSFAMRQTLEGGTLTFEEIKTFFANYTPVIDYGQGREINTQQDNLNTTYNTTNNTTKSYDKKLVWVGVGLGLGILLLTLNN